MRGQIYAMRQGPTQAFKDFAKQIQLKAKTIAMPDAEIVGICINGARPAIKANIAMAKLASMDELLKLPVVVTETQDEPQFSITMLKDINDKVDYLTSVQTVQPQQQRKTVTFERRSASRSPGRRPYYEDSGPSYPRRNQRQLYGGPTQPGGTRPYRPGPGYNNTQPRGTPRMPPPRMPGGPQQPGQRSLYMSYHCGKCFTQCRGGQQCPAYNRQCFRCGGMNHFKIACRSRPYNQFNGQ